MTTKHSISEADLTILRGVAMALGGTGGGARKGDGPGQPPTLERIKELSVVLDGVIECVATGQS